MTALRFFTDFEEVLSFVEWLREKADNVSQPILRITIREKQKASSILSGRTYSLDSLLWQLESAVEALAKIRATASLQQDLNNTDT